MLIARSSKRKYDFYRYNLNKLNTSLGVILIDRFLIVFDDSIPPSRVKGQVKSKNMKVYFVASELKDPI